MKKLSASTRVFLGLVLVVFVAKLLQILLHVPLPLRSEQMIFRWSFVVGIAVLAAVGLLFARLTDFPELWDARVGNRMRLVIPLLSGLALGVAALALDRAFGISSAWAAIEKMPTIHPPFPSSVLIYSYAAIAAEIFFHYFPLPFLVWFFSTLLFARRHQEETFWAMALVVSFWDPLTQTARLKGYPRASAATFSLAYAENFAGAYLFRRAGFLAPLLLRLAYYAVWHIIGAGLV
jgi:hypothetical protein